MAKPRIANKQAASGISESLKGMFESAKAIRFSIAFMTASGFRIIEQILDFSMMHNINSYGIIGIHRPTDIDSVDQLNRDTDDRIYINEVYAHFTETKRRIPLIHAKLVVIDYEDGRASIYIGSHNWTRSALLGPNMESGAIVDCYKKDAFYNRICSHIEEIRAMSEPFNPDKIALYKLVQKQLYENIGGPEKPKIKFDKDESLIILAEIGGPILLNKNISLYIEYNEDLSDYFQTDRKVTIYCYRKGTLFGQYGIDEYNIAGVLECQVTSSNRTQYHPTNPDSFRPYSEPEYMLRNFKNPEIVEKIVSEARKPHCQGVIKILENTKDYYIHHEGKSHPSFNIIEDIERVESSSRTENEGYLLEKIISASFEMEIKTPMKGISEFYINKLADLSNNSESDRDDDIPKRIRIVNSKQEYMFVSKHRISIKSLTELAEKYPFVVDWEKGE